MQADGPDRGAPGAAYTSLADLAGPIIKHGATVTGLSAAGGGLELILSMAGLSESQAELLASIKRDTRLLREEPFGTARTLLAEASRVGPRDSLFDQHVEGARASFYRAHSLAESARELAIIRFDIALLYLALGRAGDAAHWIGRAREAARAAIDELMRGPLVPRDPHGLHIVDERPPGRRNRPPLGARIRHGTVDGLSGLAAGLLMVPLILGHAPAWTARRRAAARAAAELVALTNLVEELAASAFDEVAPPPLLLDDARDVWTLREAPPAGHG